MRQTHCALVGLAIVVFAAPAIAETRAPSPYFGIHVVDSNTGRGVPLVMLRTTYKQTYVTDSNGYVAFLEPGLMDGADVWFDVRSYGYESPVGAFGVKGIAIKPRAGEIATVQLKRQQIAERLYRMTGYGIYRDTDLLGRPAPLKQPLLNARVTGQDSVQTAVYRGKYFWLWQDTDQLGFGLGGFSMTGGLASALPGEVDVDRGIDFTYFVEKPGGFARAMADVPRKETLPLWVDGIVVTKDKNGRERMIGRYLAARPDFSSAEQGLVVYDDDRERFVRLRQFEGTGEDVLAPTGRPFRFSDRGVGYIGFVDGVRVVDTFETASDPAAYETLTCVGTDGHVKRNAEGRPQWEWRRGVRRLDRASVDALIERGELKADERLMQLRDSDTRKPIRFAAGSVAWNPHLRRWTLLFGESLGESVVGEIWFATADSPFGPWRDAVKVATHAMPKSNNDFYNPIQHEDLARQGGRLLYFSGTFVNTFSGNPHPTPYYDYNYLLYRIDLNDPRMKLPDPPAGVVEVEPVLP